MSYTAFSQLQRIATGSRTELSAFLEDRPQGEVLVFDDATGAQVDLDTRGTAVELAPEYTDAAPAQPRGRGRPRLGVVAKEVTLLPRHWDWLNSQPGGASVALRRLVEDARRHGAAKDRARMAQERAYYFMLAIAGDLPGYEEATRARTPCVWPKSSPKRSCRPPPRRPRAPSSTSLPSPLSTQSGHLTAYPH